MKSRLQFEAVRRALFLHLPLPSLPFPVPSPFLPPVAASGASTVVRGGRPFEFSLRALLSFHELAMPTVVGRGSCLSNNCYSYWYVHVVTAWNDASSRNWKSLDIENTCKMGDPKHALVKAEIFHLDLDQFQPDDQSQINVFFPFSDSPVYSSIDT